MAPTGRAEFQELRLQEVRGLHRLLAFSEVVTPMRAKIMKITYTDSRDGMVLIGFTDERGEHEIALSTIETADLIGALRTSLRGGRWKSGRKQHGPSRHRTSADR